MFLFGLKINRFSICKFYLPIIYGARTGFAACRINWFAKCRWLVIAEKTCVVNTYLLSTFSSLDLSMNSSDRGANEVNCRLILSPKSIIVCLIKLIERNLQALGIREVWKHNLEEEFRHICWVGHCLSSKHLFFFV